MSAVIDVLPAKVPPVDLETLFLVSSLESKLFPPDLDAMSGRHRHIERFASEAPAELSFPNAAVAQEDYLDFVFRRGNKVQLSKIGA
jgi:hypothetical protein